jgi:hypothetical protein
MFIQNDRHNDCKWHSQKDTNNTQDIGTQDHTQEYHQGAHS